MDSATFDKVCAAIVHGRVHVSEHAHDEAVEDDLSVVHAIDATPHGEVIGDYPHDARGPSCLVLVGTGAGVPVHAVWAFDDGRDELYLSRCIDLCADRACTTILETLDATGTTVVPTTTLGRGVVYWRASLPGGDGSCPPSPTWEFFVNARTAPVDTSWGTVFDVNGDGYADMLVGANHPSMELGMPATPKTYLYLGGASGLAQTPAFTMDGNFPASAGDVNGDGFPEAIVHADTETYHLFHGSAAGLDPKFVVVNEPSGVITAPSQPVASAGDVDRDGYGDVIFGANFADRVHVHRVTAVDANGDGFWDVAIGNPLLDKAWVFMGGPGGASTTAAVSLDNGTVYGRFGDALGAGDYDGNGFEDLVISAPWALDVGRVYGFDGSAAGVVKPAAWTLGEADTRGFGDGVTLGASGS